MDLLAHRHPLASHLTRSQKGCLDVLMSEAPEGRVEGFKGFILFMDKILHDPKDPKLWELWYIPYNG